MTTFDMLIFLKYFGMCIFLGETEVTGINFTFSNEQILLGSTGTLKMSCNVTEIDVANIYLIQIRRNRSTSLSGSDRFYWETLAFMESVLYERPTLSLDILASNKDYSVGGAWDSLTPFNTYLTLSMNIAKLDCDDEREYRCEVTYRSNITDAVKYYKMDETFSAYVNPRVISLIARRNGLIVHGPTLSDVATVNIGDELELNCTANIGSLPGTLIRWNITFENTSIEEFVGYEPDVISSDNETADNVNQCGYIRTGLITYNITTHDVRRKGANYVSFECYVRINEDPYGSFITQDNPMFHFELKTTVKSSTSASTANQNVATGITYSSKSTTLENGIMTVVTEHSKSEETKEKQFPIEIIVGISIAVFVTGIIVFTVILCCKCIFTARTQAVPESRLDVHKHLPKSNYESLQLGTLETETYASVEQSRRESTNKI